MPADSEGMARLRRRRALILRVPLDQHARDVVAIVAADVGPPLPTGALQKINGLPGALEAQLLGRELHRVLAPSSPSTLQSEPLVRMQDPLTSRLK